MDADRLGRGEQIAGICAVILFIVMFFNWFSLPGADEANAVGIDIDTGLNAWQSYDFTDLILMVTIIVAAGGAVATLMARDVALPVAASAITAGLGILSFVFVAFSILNTPSFGALGSMSTPIGLGRIPRLDPDRGDRLRRLDVDAGGGHLLRRPGRPRQGGGGHRRPRRPPHSRRPAAAPGPVEDVPERSAREER